MYTLRKNREIYSIVEGDVLGQNDTKNGVLLVGLCYVFWGFFPLYWKLLDNVTSFEVLMNRVIWSFGFTLLFILIIKKGKQLREDIKTLWKDKRQLIRLAAASLVISLNWFIYIWAVNNDHVLQTSLGYYMNPLISVMFGVIFFKEKLDKVTVLAFIIALVGVGTLTLYYGEIPVVSLLLAFSFATYSVLKKKVTLEATRGLAIETFLMLPVALIAYAIFASKHEVYLFNSDSKTTILLLISGIVTAIPLVLFAKGATKIPLYLVGFIQYLSPTIVLFLGIFLYHEPFTKIELFAFSCIWVAVFLFSVGKMLISRKSAMR